MLHYTTHYIYTRSNGFVIQNVQIVYLTVLVVNNTTVFNVVEEAEPFLCFGSVYICLFVISSATKLECLMYEYFKYYVVM